MPKSYLLYATFIFAVMQFTLASDALFSFWFYGCMAAPLLYTLWQQRNANTTWKWCHVPLLKLILGLFIYVMLHSVFLTPHATGAADTLRHTLLTGLFVAIIILVHTHVPQARLLSALRLLLVLLIITGTVAIALFLAYEAGEEGARLVGLGQNDHPLLGANIFATFTLAGMVLLHPSSPRNHSDILLWWVGVAVTLGVMVLSQSRGPVIAFGICITLGLVWFGYWRIVLCGALLGGSVIADLTFYLIEQQHFLPLHPLYEHISEAMARKSYRLELWELAWRLIQARPWTGYGMQAIFPYGYAAVNPHNLFISSWYYTGVGGIALLLSVVIMAAREAWKARHSLQGMMAALLLLHGVLACMTDQGQMMKSPAPLWWIFWWGIAVAGALAYERYSSHRYPIEQQDNNNHARDATT